MLFRDDDDLTPGVKWKPTIGKKISECDTFMVFWCWHSNKSAPVRAEWKQAVKEGKRIVPVLLDATPLPTHLAEHQWINLRGLMHRHQKRVSYKRYGWMGAPPSAARRQIVDPTYEAGLRLRVELFQMLA